MHSDHFSLSQSVILSVLSREEIYLSISGNVRRVLTFVIHCICISSCCAISMDIPDPLSLPLPIVHCFQQVLRATSHIGTELLYVGSNWSSCFCLSISSSLLLQQCPTCLVHLILMVFVMGGCWPYSRCSILVWLLSSFFFMRLGSVNIAVLTRPLPGRNCLLFYRSSLTSILLIAYR